MKKIWVVCIFLLWCVAGYQVIQGKSMIEEAKLTEVFYTVGTEEKTAVIEYNGSLAESILPITQRKAFLKKIAGELGITENMNLSVVESADRQEIELIKEGKYARTKIKLITMEQETGFSQFVTAQITLANDVEGVLSCRKQLETAMETSDVGGKSSANVVGTYDGKLSLKKRNEISGEILNNLGARVVTQNRDMELYTIYAYTTYINEFVMQEDCAINVNIAMNYNEEENKTYLYVAVPAVGIDF